MLWSGRWKTCRRGPSTWSNGGGGGKDLLLPSGLRPGRAWTTATYLSNPGAPFSCRATGVSSTTTTTEEEGVRNYPFPHAWTHRTAGGIYGYRREVLWDPSFSLSWSSSSSSSSSTLPGAREVAAWQQVRWKRRDGNKAFQEERKPTKKQRKAYHRQLLAQQQEQERHAAPGTKAGIRREWQAFYQQDLLSSSSSSRNENDRELDPNNNSLLLEYEHRDALLDDLVGNTGHVTGAATPEPLYWGHRHKALYNRVMDQMDHYRQEIPKLVAAQAETDPRPAASTKKDRSTENLADMARLDPEQQEHLNRLLPSDDLISMAMRAFRDAKGTRQQPVGLVKALQHVLQDMGIPLSALGERTYTTLMTCCRSPAEARRVLQLMRDQDEPITAYCWSILVDVHAKLGDFKGAAAVMDEMLQNGLAPSLPAYTSFLAACYKVCNDGGRVAHKLRAEAGKLAWEKWQEMRVVGVDPDVMAYGAMLRLCAARGKPESALNILEEMRQMEVKPTTLCFSSALRAVARSQATAIRFEFGAAKTHRQREFLAKHHGNMAQQIVIWAEDAEVEFDDGFVSALIMCAAAAGDLATVKAIYVACQIRKLDHLRTIGSDSHLARLRGEGDDDDQEVEALGLGGTAVHRDALTTGENYLDPNIKSIPKRYPSFGEREYGKDTRVLSSILHACAQAVDQNGIGTMWQGRENQGYLCANSLRLMSARYIPKYEDNSIPGATRTDTLTWRGDHEDDDGKGKKGKRNKFQGVDYDDEAGATLDDLDDIFSRIYLDEDGRLKEQYRATQPEDIWRAKYGNNEFERTEAPGGQVTKILEARERSSLPKKVIDDSSVAKKEMIFDYDSMSWKEREIRIEQVNAELIPSKDREDPLADGVDEVHNDEMYFDMVSMSWKVGTAANSKAGEQNDALAREGVALKPKEEVAATEEVSDMFFDENEMRWKERIGSKLDSSKLMTEYESQVLQKAPTEVVDDDQMLFTQVDRDAFQNFYDDLKQEIANAGEEFGEVTEDEARELFLQMKDEFSALAADDEEQGDNRVIFEDNQSENSFSAKLGDGSGTRAIENNLPRDPRVATVSLNRGQHDASDRPIASSTVTSNTASTTVLSPPVWIEHQNIGSLLDSLSESDELDYDDVKFDAPQEVVNTQVEELRQVLPSFSERRLLRVLKTINGSLNNPPLLELIPLVRETMPDYITATWLKQMSALTARFVIHRATAENAVDISMLNAALELETAAGSIDRAIEFHETEFEKHGMVPTSYSDRLVLQMLVKNRRFTRALHFKQKVQERGSNIDLPSYGSLIDFCCRHGHLGSGLLLLNECLSIHGAAPGESSLTELRRLCREAGVASDVRLDELIGEDPVMWLKHSEAKLKREMSKKGRKNVLFARNALLKI